MVIVVITDGSVTLKVEGESPGKNRTKLHSHHGFRPKVQVTYSHIQSTGVLKLECVQRYK